MKIGPDKTGPGTFHDVKKAASTQDVSGLSGIELCYDLHNYLTGYIDPGTPDDLNRFLIRQSQTVDQIIAALQAASEREAKLRERLELTGDFAEGPDGIECRDDTIKLLDKRIAKLVAENERFRRALEKIANVDMGGGFLGAGACRKVALQALGREG